MRGQVAKQLVGGGHKILHSAAHLPLFAHHRLCPLLTEHSMLSRVKTAACAALRPARVVACDVIGRRCVANQSENLSALPAAPAAGPRGGTVDDAEVRKFSQLAGQWWSGMGGAFEGLHSLNRVRVPIIVSAANAARPAPPALPLAGKPLSGLSIVDIGCGGGILAQPMARLGGQVLGIDAASANVAAASLAASQDASLASSLTFECVAAEELAARGRTFDVVVSSEVIEHVADVDAFCRAACALVKVCVLPPPAAGDNWLCARARARAHVRIPQAYFLSCCHDGRRAAWRCACDDDHEPHGRLVCARHFGCGVCGAHCAARNARVGQVYYTRRTAILLAQIRCGAH